MFIPFARTDDACLSGQVYCSHSKSRAIAGTDPSGAATTTAVDDSPDASNPTQTNAYINKPGSHRFIGIAMVIVMVFAAVLVWLYYTRRPKNAESTPASSSSRRRAYFCCGSRKKSTWASPSLSTLTPTLGPNGEASQFDTDANSKPRTPVVTEKERSFMLQSEPRGLIKEVSGGLVIYTEAPRATQQGRDRYPVDSNWGFERVHGVRYETRSPERGRSTSRRTG